MLSFKRYVYRPSQSVRRGRRSFGRIAKYLAQVQSPNAPVPIEIFVMPKAKDPPNDSLNKFLERYTTHARVGTFLKEQQRGKFMDEWSRAVEGANSKPELVDMGPAVSAIMAVKDEEEMVRGLSHVAQYPSKLTRLAEEIGPDGR
jgi:nucleosome binding factor SPN SPT16 subunit